MRFSLVSVLTGLAGCAASPSGPTTPQQRKMLELLMPSRVEIVEPFTKVKSFDDDTTPDGIELLLQAVNALDNAGLMIAGTVRVELYEYVPASADQRGRQLDQWQIELSTEDHQRRYWNQVTQMYEFKLGVDSGALPLADRYVLAVTYSSPLGRHLVDTCSVQYHPKSRPMGAPRSAGR